MEGNCHQYTIQIVRASLFLQKENAVAPTAVPSETVQDTSRYMSVLECDF